MKTFNELQGMLSTLENKMNALHPDMRMTPEQKAERDRLIEWGMKLLGQIALIASSTLLEEGHSETFSHWMQMGEGLNRLLIRLDDLR